jgi:hypothetical protein
MKCLIALAAFGLATSPPAAAKSRPAGPAQPVACETTAALYALVNAEDRHDRVETARLLGGECVSLAGLHYEVVSEKNGVSRIRILPADGDRAKSRITYTLDEMLPGDAPARSGS